MSNDNKKKKERSDKYEQKLRITGSLDDVLRTSASPKKVKKSSAES
ncbi:MAG: hypothetical protein RIF36_20415 [Imperialibacter sp.]